MKSRRAPLSDPIIIAVARLVDDALTEKREPSHSLIESQIDRSGLAVADPNRDLSRTGKPVGKAKRVQFTLSWALEHDPSAGELLVGHLMGAIRGVGGFRVDSPNFVGSDALRDATDAFRSEGYLLSQNGELEPLVLDALEGREMTEALRRYSRRAQRGIDDAALVTGTAKDLLEATAAHVLVQRFGSYPTADNFPTLLGQAFVALGLSTTETSNESARDRFDRRLYELGCAVNRLRNKEGTGHGRPFLPSVSDIEARAAIEAMGVIADRMLGCLDG